MSVVVRRTAGAVVATALLCTGAVACSGGSDKGGDKKAADGTQSQSQVANAVTAAYKKTSEAKSAKVTMTMKTPSASGGRDTVKMSGTMGWDPQVMDMTMKSSGLDESGADGMPDSVRMLWQDNVMYMDMGAAAAKDADMGGKRWMKIDLAAAAKQSGDASLMSKMTGGANNMNQSPADQIAVLLDSPNLKHLGSATVDGVKAEHYKGTMSVEEMMASNDSLKVLSKSDRAQLLKNVKQAGIKQYETELWISKDDLPVRMDVTMDTSKGAVDISEKFSDYGAAIKLDVPPPSQTFDLMQMLQGAGKAAGSTAGTGA
ncbi:hypothetical protein [Streptomyces beihaiensis]|uniref:Lipoprotein n=1 Tax=Streptomyces beihaiensis TaxID=2984495 RepID=A0ABT3TZI5_9ACTN|nr:hypothetical protein [Streptomyces beihaiensis]MCX3061861.1 hypothetical protein [Streptomyces beihaiensis]